MHKRRQSFIQAFRSAAQILGALVIIVGQAGVVGAGIMHARAGLNAAAHFESDGTNLHYAHNEADCFICRAQHPDDATPVDAQIGATQIVSFVSIVTQEVEPSPMDWYAPQQSRAPPSMV